MHGSGRSWGAAFAGMVLVAALAGCVPGAPTPVPSDGGSTSASAGAPSPTPTEPPKLDLAGTAGENLAYFRLVNVQYIDGGGATDGRSLIDNLVDAGFPKAAMEVTPDRTTVNAEADQVQYSVRLNGTCLI